MWRRSVVVLTAVSVVLLLASCGDDGGGGSSDGATTTQANAGGNNGSPAEVGEPAPDASYFTFDGGSASIGDYAGRPLVVNFWASWCPPCITEMPAFEQVHQRLGDEVAFLGIDVQETASDGQAFLDQVEVTWDLGRDPDGSVVRRLGGIGMPTTVLVDADGVVQAIHTGELSADELSGMIDERLLGR
jgi:thiol-disulfide isomerase/thioredoxin